MAYQVDPMDLLRQIGFNVFVAQARESLTGVPGTLARVIEHSRSRSVIHTGAESYEARSTPSLARTTPIIVGDWVLADANADADGGRGRGPGPGPGPGRGRGGGGGGGGGEWWIRGRLTPYTEFHRIDPSGARQALVTNVDTAFLVMGLDGDYNLRRIERYIALAKSAGASPVVVLTKADLCSDLDNRLASLARRLPPSVEWYAVNATDSATVECLAAHLGPGQTAVLLGSSGAGKSTLTNTLTQSATQETGAVRASDSRGRHSTTGRQLRQLPGGGCLIDTPGLRGLRLDIDKRSLHASFEDIAALAAGCRFRDCAHDDEPGCAVRAGLAPDRLANYQKLCREVSRDRADPLARRRAKAEVKSQQRALRAMQKERAR